MFQYKDKVKRCRNLPSYSDDLGLPCVAPVIILKQPLDNASLSSLLKAGEICPRGRGSSLSSNI